MRWFRRFAPFILLYVSGTLAAPPDVPPYSTEAIAACVAHRLSQTGTNGKVHLPSGDVEEGKLVSGLYEAIPAVQTMEIEGLRIVTKKEADGVTSTTTLSHNGIFGDVIRGFEVLDNGHSITFDRAVLVDPKQGGRVPSFVRVPGVPDLVPGRGVPTLAFVTMQQMRREGIPPGGLRVATSIGITNCRTKVEILISKDFQEWRSQHPHESAIPTDVMARGFWKTQSARYMRTVLTQSEHRIKTMGVSKTRLESTYTRAQLGAEDPSALAMLEDYEKRAGVHFTDPLSLPGSIGVRFTLEPAH